MFFKCARIIIIDSAILFIVYGFKIKFQLKKTYHCAGEEGIVLFLLQSRASVDVDVTDNLGNTPLHLAASYGIGIVQFIVLNVYD